ncbi:MAG: RNA polymerase sigma factor, partial [Mycobacteriaceae bacterium]
LAMVRGPNVGLHALQLAAPVLGEHHRITAVRAHLLELDGQPDQARQQYALAAQTTLNLAERGYLV